MGSRVSVIVSCLSMLAVASCAASSAKNPAPPGLSTTPSPPSPPSPAAAKPLAVPNQPSFALLRDFADGKPAAAGLIDPKRGLIVVTVGPAYDPDGDGESSDVDDAKRVCGDEAVRRGIASIRFLFSNAQPGGDLDAAHPCESLRCDKPAAGEWDQDTSFTFHRAVDGGLVLDSIVNVLDVPLRPDAEKDFDVAEKHRTELGRTQCPTPARRP
ncbi:MAG: hypothetical protein ACRELY_22995 [Polyangiaceae bacterium]